MLSILNQYFYPDLTNLILQFHTHKTELSVLDVYFPLQVSKVIQSFNQVKKKFSRLDRFMYIVATEGYFDPPLDMTDEKINKIFADHEIDEYIGYIGTDPNIDLTFDNSLFSENGKLYFRHAIYSRHHFYIKEVQDTYYNMGDQLYDWCIDIIPNNAKMIFDNNIKIQIELIHFWNYNLKNDHDYHRCYNNEYTYEDYENFRATYNGFVHTLEDVAIIIQRWFRIISKK